jgi:RNA-binding protein PNO1
MYIEIARDYIEIARDEIFYLFFYFFLIGSFANIKIARDAVCDLILGTQPGKVYTKLRAISSRLKERF